jgi:hypothetical protein
LSELTPEQQAELAVVRSIADTLRRRMPDLDELTLGRVVFNLADLLNGVAAVLSEGVGPDGGNSPWAAGWLAQPDSYGPGEQTAPMPASEPERRPDPGDRRTPIDWFGGNGAPTGSYPAITSGQAIGPRPAVSDGPATGPYPVVSTDPGTGPHPVVPQGPGTGPYPIVPQGPGTGPFPAVSAGPATGPFPAVGSGTGPFPAVSEPPGAGTRPALPQRRGTGPRPGGPRAGGAEPSDVLQWPVGPQRPGLPGGAATGGEPADPDDPFPVSDGPWRADFYQDGAQLEQAQWPDREQALRAVAGRVRWLAFDGTDVTVSLTGPDGITLRHDEVMAAIEALRRG